MSLITCNECSKEISDKATACPHCGAPAQQAQQTAGIMQCPKCALNLVPIERRSGFTFTAFIGLLAFLGGLPTLLFSPIVGLFMIAIGVLLDRFGRDKKLFMVCPSCKYEAADKSSFSYELGRMIGGSSK